MVTTRPLPLRAMNSRSHLKKIMNVIHNEKKIITDLQANVKKKISASLSYKLDNSLLYSIKYNDRKCFCISDILIENIFKITHDEIRHCRFDKAFEHFYKLTINKTSCQLQVYIDEC